MKKKNFHDLGKLFYDWRKAGKVEMVYSAGAKDVEQEIQRISQLIEYVKKKKRGGHI